MRRQGQFWHQWPNADLILCSPNTIAKCQVALWLMRFPGDAMRRRDLITFLGSIAAAWPLRARAQPFGRTRRIGVLMGVAEDDPEGTKYLRVFQEALRALGWRDGQDVHFDYRAAADL